MTTIQFVSYASYQLRNIG